MLTSRLGHAAVTSVVLCVAAQAQGTVTDSNVTYTVGTIGAAQADSVDCDFTANAAADPDMLNEHWWHYRIEGDADEKPFNSVNLTQSYVGSHADLDWSDVDNLGLISAELDIDAISKGATAGLAQHRMRITNISGSTIRVHLFAYADVDLCSVANDVVAPNSRHHITSATCPTEELTFRNPALFGWQAGVAGADELGLVNGAAGGLSNSGLPFSGDYSGAAHWRLDLLPGESASVVSALELNDYPCPAFNEKYGPAVAGTNGVPSIGSDPAIIGETIDVTCWNCLEGTDALLILGIDEFVVPIGGLTLVVVPAFTVGVLDTPADDFSVSIPIPDNPDLCNAHLHAQWFFFDVNGAPIGLAQTPGLYLTLGEH